VAYSVRQSEALPVAETLTGLWRRNLHIPPRIDLTARLRWYYVDAPEGPGRVMLLVATTADGEAVVGCEGIGVRRFAVAGQPGPVRAALLGDLAVDRAHRTLMPALNLVRAGRAAARELPLHYGFPNAAAAPLFERAGYRKLGTVTRWVRVLRHARYVKRVLANRTLARASGALLDAARLAEAAVAAVSSSPLRLERLADVDDRVDRLWDAAHRQWGVIAWRGAAFLRWRFLREPASRCEIVCLCEPRTRELRAYAVLEPDDDVTHIRDFLGVSARDVARLLDEVALRLYRRGAAAMSVSFLGAPRVEALLRSRHFMASPAERVVFADAAPGVTIPAAERWYLTDADEDS
jgi:hypothetical protein